MKAIIALVAAPAALGLTLPWSRGFGADASPAERRETRSVDAVASSYVSLRKVPGPDRRPAWGRSSLSSFRGDDEDVVPANSNSTTPAKLTFLYSTNYVANVSIGNQQFQVVVDTGSSDTWLVKSNFSCLDNQNQLLQVLLPPPRRQSLCSFCLPCMLLT